MEGKELSKPLIGVTCYLEETVNCEKKFSTSPLYISYPQYNLRLAEAGAVPVNIPPINADMATAKEFAEKLDALLLCGGEDVSPDFYCENASGDYRYVLERDKFEFALLGEFLKTGKPILGICRGLQLINIYFGGTLIQDIATASEEYLEHTRSDVPTEGVHKVKLNGPWAEKLGTECVVNSLHHQAIKRLGKGLEVVGISEDGLIEAVEAVDYPLFAVQWHPEMLLPTQKPIFDTFVQYAKSSILK